MRGKIFQINHKLSNSDYDLVCLQESWLNDTVQNNELTHNTPYDMFRFDRCQSSNMASTGGGVITLAHHNLSAIQLDIGIQSPLIEALAINITSSHTANWTHSNS